jgi:hypothetical protein
MVTAAPLQVGPAVGWCSLPADWMAGASSVWYPPGRAECDLRMQGHRGHGQGRPRPAKANALPPRDGRSGNSEKERGPDVRAPVLAKEKPPIPGAGMNTRKRLLRSWPGFDRAMMLSRMRNHPRPTVQPRSAGVRKNLPKREAPKSQNVLRMCTSRRLIYVNSQGFRRARRRHGQHTAKGCQTRRGCGWDSR